MSVVLPQTNYETVIGLEVHVQLKTRTKLFCNCPIEFGQKPNQNTCPVCLALPGALPVLNQTALQYAIQIGLGLNCTIANTTQFERKQYFYPDLPKGYQISQADKPVSENGSLTLSNGKKVRVLRAHLEEDAGKLVHAGATGLSGSDYSLVDLNRAGTPLVEIVSMPDMSSAEEARDYMTLIRNIVRYLGVCDGNLEEGSLRCDANVSIRPKGTTTLGTRAEIKNMNSFRSVQRAIEAEVARQIDLVESGGSVIQETRLWNEATGTTLPMRGKEAAHDYRYFPDPDLRPIPIDSHWVESLKATLPELPHQRLEKFTQHFGMTDSDAHLLTEVKELGDFFEAVAQHCQQYKTIINWLVGDITAYLHSSKKELFHTRLTPEALAQLTQLIENNTLSSAMAKKILVELLEKGGMPEKLAKESGAVQITDESAIRAAIQGVLDKNPKDVAEYLAGKDKVLGFLVGQVMKETKGMAKPDLVNQLLKEILAR